MPRPTAIETAQAFRQQLLSDEAQAASRMATIYNRIYTGLQGDIGRLSVDIAAMDSPTRGAIMKLARMQAIQQQVKEQVTKFGGAVQNEVTIVQSQAVQAGIDNALTLIEASLPPLAGCRPYSACRLIRPLTGGCGRSGGGLDRAG